MVRLNEYILDISCIERKNDCSVSKTTHDEILADYYVFEYGEQKADPYKSLVYKIIGRCELNKKTTRIMKNQEDYLWLQVRRKEN